MDRLEFEDYEELACKIADDFEEIKGDFKDVAIIAKYDEAREMIRQLICLGYPVHSIHLDDEEWDGYEDEFIVSLSDTGEKEIWCEPFKRDGKYLTDESVIGYVFDNCSSKCLENVECDTVYEIGIIDECDGDCDNCKEYSGETNDGSTFHVKVVGDLNLHEAMAKMDEMETRMNTMSAMFNHFFW